MADMGQLTMGLAQHEKEHAGSQIAITLSESSDISRTKGSSSSRRNMASCSADERERHGEDVNNVRGSNIPFSKRHAGQIDADIVEYDQR